MNDDDFKTKWEKSMQEPGRALLFAIYMTPDGPVVDIKGDPRFVLKLLGSACEDLRETIAVNRLRNDIMQAAKQAEDQQRIQVVGANGVPKPNVPRIG